MSENLLAESGLQRGEKTWREEQREFPAPANIIISIPVSLTKQVLLMEL